MLLRSTRHGKKDWARIDGTIKHFRYGIKLTLKKKGACDLGYKYSLMMSPGDFNNER